MMSTFQKLLEDYIDVTEKDALKRKEIEEKIWESYGNKGAIIVWDMSNFSSTAKNMGIVYFLSLMEIAKNEYIPIIEKHNGISSVIEGLGNERGFHRLRIGVGHPGDRDRVTAYLTSVATPAKERAAIEDAIVLPDEVIGQLLDCQFQKVMNWLHAPGPAAE